MSARFFSTNYHEARNRFREAADEIGAETHAYRLRPEDDSLTIDVAIIGGDAPCSLVTTSGVHGVEGFLGSAIQLAWMARGQMDSVRQVFVHAVNPYGFANLRRVNEDNVDLNRNFLLPHETYEGAPPEYVQLDGLLNPTSPPSRWEPFRLKAAWHIARRGMSAVQQAVAGGQYDFPRGLFFGGKEPAASTRILQEHMSSWIGNAQRVMHIDFPLWIGRQRRIRNDARR